MSSKSLLAALSAILLLSGRELQAQSKVYRDTMTVYEAGIALPNPWAGGLNFCAFSPLDVNGDGKQDLVVYDKVYSNYNRGKVRVFLNMGNPGQTIYQHAPEYEASFPANTDWMMLYDYNGDGKEDLFTYVTGGIMVYKNTSTLGNLNFTLMTSLLNSTYFPTTSPQVSNIPCSSVALPGIGDIDGDGDLDILTYSVFGIQLEYHKNMSREKYGHSDSLTYEMVDDCWGLMKENTCVVYLHQCPVHKLFEKLNNDQHKTLHAGSCIMCFDRDKDGDMDAVLGDISCSTVDYIENCGDVSDADICDTTKLYPNFPANGNTTYAKMNAFPCTYYLDIDGDGAKDFIASPNSPSGSENYKSVWYYKNMAAPTAPVDFQFVQKNFLQDGMIELGEGAYPAMMDYNGDGKLDLVVGNVGYYTVNINKSRMALYQNIGSTTAPTFSLITRNFAALDTLAIGNMAPTFGDLDGDGDQDMIIGDSGGKLHYFENLAGAGNTVAYGNIVASYFNIDVGNFAFPQLVDVDRDGKLDLLIGSQNGRITYYRNTGSATVPNFVLQTAFLGNVDVKIPGLVTGFSVPFLYDDAGTSKLLVGSENGNIFLYTNIDNNLSGSFTKADTNVFGIYEGARSALSYYDLNGDGQRDMIVGNYAGGLTFYSSINHLGVGIEEQSINDESLSIYPNPATETLHVSLRNDYLNDYTITLYDLLGNTLYQEHSNSKHLAIPVDAWAKGVYLLRIVPTKGGPGLTKKLIID